MIILILIISKVNYILEVRELNWNRTIYKYDITILHHVQRENGSENSVYQ